MTRAELNRFEMILTARQEDLTRATRNRDGIAIERAADAVDELQLSREREMTTRNLERNSAMLSNVRAALGRIAEGTYGNCLECEEEISSKRLMAVPWATLCIGCQESAAREVEFLRMAA